MSSCTYLKMCNIYAYMRIVPLGDISLCLSFHKTKLNTITKKIMGPCLAAAGYSSKMPRTVVFGPRLYGGMQWDTPHSILLTSQLTMLVGSLRLQDAVGQMLQIKLELLQLNAGMETPVLETTRTIPYLPSGWLRNLHELLVEAGIQVKLHKSWKPKHR